MNTKGEREGTFLHLEWPKTCACQLCPAQEEAALPVWSLRLSSAGDLSSSVPRPAEEGLGCEEALSEGSVWCGWHPHESRWLCGCHCGIQGSGEVWERIPGSCFHLAVRSCYGCAAPWEQSSDNSHSGWRIAALQGFSALLLWFHYFLPVALWQHFCHPALQDPCSCQGRARDVLSAASPGFALWLSSLKSTTWNVLRSYGKLLKVEKSFPPPSQAHELGWLPGSSCGFSSRVLPLFSDLPFSLHFRLLTLPKLFSCFAPFSAWESCQFGEVNSSLVQLPGGLGPCVLVKVETLPCNYSTLSYDYALDQRLQTSSYNIFWQGWVD